MHGLLDALNDATITAYEDDVTIAVNSLWAADRIVALGVGKSGIAADYFASALRAYGVHAYSMHPTDVLHGDAGGIGTEDAMVFFSASANTVELVDVVISVRKNALVGVYGQEGDLVGSTAHPIITGLGPVADAPFAFVPSISFMAQIEVAAVLACLLARKLGAPGLRHTHAGGHLGSAQPWNDAYLDSRA